MGPSYNNLYQFWLYDDINYFRFIDSQPIFKFNISELFRATEMLHNEMKWFQNTSGTRCTMLKPSALEYELF